MFRRRHFLIFESLADFLLYFAQSSALARMDDSYRHTGLVGASCSSGTMGVDRHIIGKPIVYHMREVVNIKTSGGHIGCHKKLRHMVAEFLHCQGRAAPARGRREGSLRYIRRL